VRSSFFYASGEVDLLTTLTARLRDYTAAVNLVDNFAETYSDFAIPRVLERIYDSAIVAASKLGQQDKLTNYRQQQASWQAVCPISDESGNFPDQSVLDPEHAKHWLQESGVDGTNFIRLGDNAVRLMLHWAAFEWDEGLFSTDDVRSLFAPGLNEMPDRSVSTCLRNLTFDYIVVSVQLFGTAQDLILYSKSL